MRYPAGHVDIYIGNRFELVVADHLTSCCGRASVQQPPGDRTHRDCDEQR